MQDNKINKFQYEMNENEKNSVVGTQAKDAEKRQGKVVCILLIGSIVLITIFCFFVKINNETIHTINISSYEENKAVTYVIDQNTVGEYGIVSGYAYIEGEAIDSVNVSIALYQTQCNQYIAIPTELQVRDTLKNTDSIDYSNAGFYAKVKASKLNSPINTYQIVILYKNNGHNYLVKTNQTLGMQ